MNKETKKKKKVRTSGSGRSNTSKSKRKKHPQNSGIAGLLSTPAGKIIRLLVIVIVILLAVSTIHRKVVEFKASKITIEELQQCESKEEYLDMVMPLYRSYCKKFHIKYPGILALQVFYEVGAGFPQNLSDVAIADNNLGGLKYVEGIPGATVGAYCPPDEGGNYCHFETVGDYIYAQCWQIGQPLYKDVRKHRFSVKTFTRTLCNMWIGGVKGSGPYGYSEDLIEDYFAYGLD